MSTEILTLVAAVTLIAGLFVVAITELYRRRLAKAALSASAMCAAAHIAFVMIAWREAASAYLEAHLTMRWGELPTRSPIASLPTVAYDATAWAAIVFLMMSVVLGAVEFRRRKAAEKEMAAFLMDFFGGDKPKKNESEKD